MYLIELAGIEPSLGSEIFKVNGSPSHSNPTFSLVRVTGETGIQTSASHQSDDAQVRSAEVWVGLSHTTTIQLAMTLSALL